MLDLDTQWEALPPWLTNLDPGIYHTPDYVVVDFETTNINKGDPRNPNNRIVLAVWTIVKNGHIERKVQWGNEYAMEELVTDIEGAQFLVAHNAQFELGWLRRCGYDVTKKPVFCTQIAEYVLAGNRHWGLSLDACLARRKLGGKMSIVSQMIHNGVCPSEIPTMWLEQYCIMDVEQDHKLFLQQLPLLEKWDLLPVFFGRCLATPMLADINQHGMHLDERVVDTLHVDLSAKLLIAERTFEEFTGGVNVKSTKQMREYLFEVLKFGIPKDYRGRPMETEKGNIQVGTDAINALKPKNKKQRCFIKLRNELTKLRDAKSKYIRHFKRCIDETDDHIIYANFNQTVTDTHRLSSTGANGFSVQFQNIDRRFKSAISARTEGWYISERDYAQLEYRCAVDMAGDKAGLQDILNGVDAHALSASTIYKEKWDCAHKAADKAAIKAIRQDAKPDTFKPLYGGQSGTPLQQAYYQAFKTKHVEVTAWQDTNISTVLNTGKLRVPSGLIFYWPNTRVTSTGYILNSANICNYPVQNFATGDIVPLGVVFFWHRLKQAKLNSFLVNTIHDSAIGEVDPDEVQVYHQLGEQAMIEDVKYALQTLFDYEFTTPLDAEEEFFYNWSGDVLDVIEG